MWYLTSESDHRILYVLPSKEITIGRPSVDTQVCNFAITEDPSISRRHAILSVSGNILHLQDLGSRYGTFVNESMDKLESNLKVKLNNNDVIKFGKMGSVWKAHEISFVTCTSTLKGENLQNLRQCLGNVGGLLKNDWDESCMYLTMPAITLTIKVVLALAQGSHIVTPEFWTKCVEAVNNQTVLPQPSTFTPQVIESTLNKENVSFLPNDERNTLFAGKSVIFFSRRQLDMYKAVLLRCSAAPMLLSETKMTKSMLCDKNIILIQYNLTNTSQETETQRNLINDIINYLKSKGKRVVADAEIGLAILYCSTNKYCNPDFNFSSEVIKQTPGQNTKSAILAPETQESTIQGMRENVVINESLTASGNNSKRKLSDENNDIEMNATKKLATGIIKTDTNNESVKRKFCDDTNGTQNPNKKMAIDNDEDDMFNFATNAANNENRSTERKLNFSKPLKRKADKEANEDDLFNFVQDKSKISAGDTSRSNLFDVNKDNIKEEIDTEIIEVKKNRSEEKIDISALRGSKLNELMELNKNAEFNPNICVKKEDPDDLDTKMYNLDLGTTIVIIRADLIKKEPVYIEAHNRDESCYSSHLKNFKKFKKIWAVHKQATVIPKPSINFTIPDTAHAEEISSLSY